MKRLLLIFAAIVLLSLFTTCEKGEDNPQTDVQTQRALAETEANRQKVLVAQAEKEKIEAELKLLKEKERISEEKVRKNSDEESKVRKRLSKSALTLVQNSAKQILRNAYPLAMNKLKYTSSKLIGVAKSTNGFIATVRLNYRNLFNKQHFLDLRFDYDQNGSYKSWKFVNHSDLIAPKELTFSNLLKLIQ